MKASVAILETLYDLEGDTFVHDPEATRMGITQTEYDKFRAGKGLPVRSVEFIEEPEAIEIYDKRYWSPMKCGQLPDGVDFVLFQMGVNIGTNRSVRILQKIVGTDPDGLMGPQTIAAAKAFGPDLVDELFRMQGLYYDSIYRANPTRNQPYINGWHNRITKAKIFLATGLTQKGIFAGGLGFLVLVILLFYFASRFIR